MRRCSSVPVVWGPIQGQGPAAGSAERTRQMVDANQRVKNKLDRRSPEFKRRPVKCGVGGRPRNFRGGYLVAHRRVYFRMSVDKRVWAVSPPLPPSVGLGRILALPPLSQLRQDYNNVCSLRNKHCFLSSTGSLFSLLPNDVPVSCAFDMVCLSRVYST